MGFSASGTGNAFMQASDVGLNKITDKINDIFDIENPDGVQSNLETSLGILTSNAVSGLLSGSVLSQSKNKVLPVVLTGDSIKPGPSNYQQLAPSETFKLNANAGESTTNEGKAIKAKTLTLGDRPYSLFNRFSLVNYRGTMLASEGNVGSGFSSKFYNKIDPASLINPTASKIIDMTSAIPGNMGYTYNHSDFAMAKYYGKIPNNMLITLRRFAFPAPDDIISPKAGGDDTSQPDIARAVTWMSEETGNSMAEMIKFSTGYGWEDAEADMQTLESQKGAQSGAFGKKINSSTFLSSVVNAMEGTDAETAMRREANAGYDSFGNTYPNHVFGPLNVIKQVLVRKPGLEYNQEFTLKFEYELRDIGGANPKILMLDQLSNILALTYSNAPFWGGATRYIGDGSVAKPLGDTKLLKSGDYKGFLGSVVSQFTGKNTGDAKSDITEWAKGFIADGSPGKMLNQFLSGSMMQMFNTPQGGQAAASLLTGDATGQWHVTIGNPLNPIAVIGNLACTGTSINFEGPLGIQDFPERLVVTVTLKPARPRDKAEIESMFNTGRGRFYIQPDDEGDINKTMDVSQYGNRDKSKAYHSIFRKMTSG